MMKYASYVTTSQSGGEGQGDTQTNIGTDIQMGLDRTDIQTYGNRYHTYNLIGIYLEKNPIIVLMVKLTS